jgi:hypothetical protein
MGEAWINDISAINLLYIILAKRNLQSINIPFKVVQFSTPNKREDIRY